MDSPADATPFVIDLTGRDILGEAERIRALGPVTRVEMPSGVRAWAVSDQGLLRRLLVDPRMSKDAYQHWPAWIKGEISSDWPLFPWVTVRNMLTAYGPDHRRLRGLAAGAFTARRVAALRSRIEAITGDLLNGLASLACAGNSSVQVRGVGSAGRFWTSWLGTARERLRQVCHRGMMCGCADATGLLDGGQHVRGRGPSSRDRSGEGHRDLGSAASGRGAGAPAGL